MSLGVIHKLRPKLRGVRGLKMCSTSFMNDLLGSIILLKISKLSDNAHKADNQALKC